MPPFSYTLFFPMSTVVPVVGILQKAFHQLAALGARQVLDLCERVTDRRVVPMDVTEM